MQEESREHGSSPPARKFLLRAGREVALPRIKFMLKIKLPWDNKKEEWPVGSYVSIQSDEEGHPVTRQGRGLIVFKRGTIYTVQSSGDELLRVTSRQFEAPRGGVRLADPMVSSFLNNLSNKCNHRTLDRNWLKKQFDLISKNKLILDVFLNTNQDLIILTHDLPVFDYHGKKTKYYVGRMAIKIDAHLYQPLMVKNLDWWCDKLEHSTYGTEHPHARDDQSICFGNSEGTLARCWAGADLYSLVETMLDLLTNFDLADSDYMRWFECRDHQNPGRCDNFIGQKARIKWN